MYERFYGLATKPFALTPDPAFLFPSRKHAMALTMLEYGIESQAAFMLLTGEIGSGKTTLVRRVIRDFGSRAVIGLISNAHARFRSIHEWVASALGIAVDGDSDIARYEAVEDFCVRAYAQGRRTLLIVDEAQNLSTDILEELRLLSNINSEQDLVLQVLLVGQPELRATLKDRALCQLVQRFSVDVHLRPLDREETHAYVRHRLATAGATREIFAPDALEFIFARTGGVPRLVNHLCDLALVYGYADARSSIDAELMAQVLRDRTSDGALPVFIAATASPAVAPLPTSAVPVLAVAQAVTGTVAQAR